MTQQGVLLVGHGTRDAVGTEQFFQLGRLLEQQLSPMPAVACLLEFQEPTIPQAWNQLVAAGVQHIHVAPLLLFAAGHAKQDIPDLVRECQSKTPHVTFEQSGPLSRHHAIVELLIQRAQSAAKDVDPATTALVMVGRGSYDPCAQADMRILTALIGHRMNFADALTAFYAMAQPKLPTVLDDVATRSVGTDIGVATNVIVQPHLLFQGRLYDAIERQVDEAAQRHPSIRFHLGDYLGPSAEVTRAIHDRVTHSARHSTS